MVDTPSNSPYAPGQHLGGSPYAIVRLLGRGGMAVVYEAEDTSCGRRVAIKVVRPDVATRGAFDAERMRREARQLVSLQRKTDHVVEVITAGVTDDSHRLPYYVMELLEGHTLRTVFDRKRAEGAPLGLDEGLGIVIDLAMALDQAHRLDITHLDVKPENAFVHRQRSGTLILKLLDFGISAKLGETLGGFRGTYRYAAPEQIRGTRVSAATDLYALGLVLFEALALRRPFEPDGISLDREGWARAQCEAAAPPLAEVRSGVPPELERLVAQCLEKRPENRPPSAAFVIGRLREIRGRLGGGAANKPYLLTLTTGTSLRFEEVISGTALADHVRAGRLPGSPVGAHSEVFVTAPVVPPAAPPRPSSASEAPVAHSVLRRTGWVGRASLIVAASTVPLAFVFALVLLVRGWIQRQGAQIGSMSTPAPVSSVEDPAPTPSSSSPPSTAPVHAVAEASDANSQSPVPSPEPATVRGTTRVPPRPRTRPTTDAAAGITTEKEWF
jgi:serine/threonine protein kinase